MCSKNAQNGHDFFINITAVFLTVHMLLTFNCHLFNALGNIDYLGITYRISEGPVKSFVILQVHEGKNNEQIKNSQFSPRIDLF